MSLAKKSVAEFIGTFWLVLGGCGSAVIAAGYPELGIGFVGVSLAFGLTVLTMAYAIGHISGCHLNPAVSVGLAVAGRFKFSELPAYIIAQVLGAIVRNTEAAQDTVAALVCLVAVQNNRAAVAQEHVAVTVTYANAQGGSGFLALDVGIWRTVVTEGFVEYIGNALRAAAEKSFGFL